MVPHIPLLKMAKYISRKQKYGRNSRVTLGFKGRKLQQKKGCAVVQKSIAFWKLHFEPFLSPVENVNVIRTPENSFITVYFY